jgi:predicted NBD/HSP70 family sugar kinase
VESTETTRQEALGYQKESAVEIKKSRLKKDILRTLFASNSYSLSELSEILFLSIPSMASLVDDLQSEGWISGEEIETGKQGRKPMAYFINPSYKANVLIDISINSLSLYLINFRNEILFQKEYDSPLEDNPKYLEALLSQLKSFIDSAEISQYHIELIGISMPGLINSDKGKNFTYRNIRIGSYGICEKISKNLKMPCYMVNDSKATVNGEALYGLGKDLSHVLSINVDWGVGLAMYTDGHIYSGANGFAGELGHIQVAPDGELCSCGKVGCLDTITSASSLLKSIRKGLKEGKISRLSTYKDEPESINLEMIIEAVQSGDEFAIDLLYNIGLEIGKGLSIAVHLFNPQIIIIDGLLSKAGKFIVNPVEHTINKFCLPDFKEDLKIEVTQLGNFARLAGLNAFLAHKLFKVE